MALAPLIALTIPPRSLLGAGPLGHANTSASLYLLAGAAALMSAGVAESPGSRRMLHLLALTWLTAPLLMGTPLASVGSLGVLLAWALVARPSSVRGVLIAGAALLTLTVGATAVAGATYAPGDRGGAIDALLDRAVGEFRVALWHDAVGMIGAEPLTGVGAGRFSEVGPMASERHAASWAHSEYLQFTAETGILGGALLAGLIGWGFVALWRRPPDPRHAGALVACIVVALIAAVDHVWRSPVVPLAVAVLLVVLLERHPNANTDAPLPPTTGTRRAALVAASMGALVIAPIVPTNASFTVANDVEWLPDRTGIQLTGRGGVTSLTPPEPLYQDLVAADALTIELTLAPEGLLQSGPARLLSLSDGTDARNLTIGQDEDRLVVRLRTTETDGNGAEVAIPDVFVTTEPVHLVITSDLRETRVHVDGALRLHGPGPGGSFANWDPDYPLLIGNERGGERPWAGRVFLAALHDRVLDQAEVDELYQTHAADETAASRRSDPLALYTFREGAGRDIRDPRELSAAGRLVIPERFAATLTGPAWSLSSLPGPDLFGLLLHVVVAGAGAFALYPLVRSRITRRGLAWVLASSLLIVVTMVAITVAMWPRDDVPDDPDAVVVLGGSGMERLRLGVQLSERHDARLVLSSSAIDLGERLGLACGIDVICIEPTPETTAGEAHDISVLAAEQGWDDVAVATAGFHTTRSRVLFRQCLGDGVSVVGTPGADNREVSTYVREVLGTAAAFTVRRAC